MMFGEVVVKFNLLENTDKFKNKLKLRGYSDIQKLIAIKVKLALENNIENILRNNGKVDDHLLKLYIKNTIHLGSELENLEARLDDFSVSTARQYKDGLSVNFLVKYYEPPNTRKILIVSTIV